MHRAAAIVLTGGSSSRFGAHKPAADLAGRPLVAHVLDAVAHLPTVVVGRADGVPGGITVVQEDPPGGGPVAGLAEAVRHLPPTEIVVVLAADLPLVDRAAVDRLVENSSDRPAVYVDADGYPQWLCAAWPLPVLTGRFADIGDPAGVSMKRLASGVERNDLSDPSGITAADVDTPADLARLRAVRPH
ncbi:molybdenum cofactor guanylyltransferase [Propionibacteriaceae bacterium Y2011]